MPVTPTRLIDVLRKNKSKRLAAVKVIESNPNALSVLPKLVQDNTLTASMSNDAYNINRSLLEDIYNRIHSVKDNNKNIIKLFPDIELAIQVLVSSILSPKKMTDIQIQYKLNSKMNISPNLSSEIMKKLSEYIEDNYEIEDKLPEIVREALFNSGACVYTVISEAAVDDIINADINASYSSESFKTSIESFIRQTTSPINFKPLDTNLITSTSDSVTSNKKITDFITKAIANETLFVTDNPNILQYGEVREKLTERIIKRSMRSGISYATESNDLISYTDIFRNKSTRHVNSNIQFVKDKKNTRRKSIGKPLVTKIPTESIIPIVIPGNETEHVGYFLLLDETGKPLNTDISQDQFNKVTNILNQSGTSNQTPIQKAYRNLVSEVTDKTNVTELFNLYKEVLEKQIFNSMKDALYGKNVTIANKNDIYFLMFTRALSDQRTSLLYLPKELVTYFAFQYNDIGIGKSLLENLSVLSSLRAILLFAKVMAYAKHSIDVTKVNISLDPNDPDPEHTIEQVQDAVLKLRQNYFPLGINNPIDLVSWIQRAGLQFSYDNNPRLPNVKIDFENANLTHTIPESEIEEDLRKQTILALGISPETVDSGFSPEFATTIVNNNILLSKRVTIYQKSLKRCTTKLVNALIYNDEDLRVLLKTFILENKDELATTLSEHYKTLLNQDEEAFANAYIDLISENVYIDLPKPDNTNITTLAMEYEVYKSNLDNVIESVISTEMFSSDISGEISNHIDTIRNVYKHHLLRKWMAENNFYPEVLEFSVEATEETENMLIVISNHLKFTMRNSDKLLNIMQKFKEATNSDLVKIDGDGADEGSSSSSNSDSNSDSDEGSDDEDLGGMDLDF